MAYWITLLFYIILISCIKYGTTQESPPTSFVQYPNGGSTEYPGNSQILVCRASGGYPNPRYTWFHNGVQFQTNITKYSIRLENVQRVDAGDYHCIASNEFGAIRSKKGTLNVAYIENFPTRSTDETLSVSAGQAIKIPLPVIASHPPILVEWWDGSSNTQITNIGNRKYYITLSNDLVILETSAADAQKQFYAKAKNTFMPDEENIKTTHNFKLSVQATGDSSAIPPEIFLPPKDKSVTATVDVSAELECVANARPLTSIVINWYRKNADSNQRELIQRGSKYFFEWFNQRLIIREPSPEDAGEYECEVAMSGTSRTASAKLIVNVAPTLDFIPPDQYPRDFGETIEIPCNATGFPQPTITWYRNAVNISKLNNDRYTVTPTGALQIKNLDPADDAMYQCFASNVADTTDFAVWLQVQSSAPEFTSSKPGNISIIQGQDARFPCEAKGAPKPYIWWTRESEGQPAQNITSSGRFQILERELLIASADSTDSGKYTCSASNMVGTISTSAYLSVAIRTQITQPPENVIAIKGSDTTLHCGVTHDVNVQVTITWYIYVGGRRTPAVTSDGHRSNGPDGKLLISQVRNIDIGTYECIVVSSGGNDSRTANLTIIELPHPPTILRATLNSANQKSVDIVWAKPFNGNTPILRYVIQQTIVPEGGAINVDWDTANNNVSASLITYTIARLQPAKVYQFRIRAVNSVGEGQYSNPSESVTIPQQPPSAPARGVVGTSKSSTSIILQWQPPELDNWNGPLKGFQIRYRLHNYNNNWSRKNKTVDASITPTSMFHFELSGLIVFEGYEIGVAAYNDEGVGVFSTSIVVSTQEGSPDVSPTLLQVTALNSTTIQAEWTPPDSQRINGINLGYKLFAVQNSTSREVMEIIPTDPNNLFGTQIGQIMNLEKYTVYKITVLCYTGKGDGPKFEPPKVVRTLEDVPDAVRTMNFDDITDRSVRVEWTPPSKTNGILTGYTVTAMKKNDSSTKATHNLGPSAHNHTVSNLEAETIYTIEVFARTSVGPGPGKSADIKSGVPPELPEPPTSLAISNIDARTVLIQFQPGYDGKTSITKWIVEAEVDMFVNEIFEIHAPEARVFTVEGLRPYTKYRLRIIAENIKGRSSPSEWTNQFQTIQSIPETAPRDVTVRAENETAIRVSWKPLPAADWNGEAQGYRVEYRQKGLLPFRSMEVIVQTSSLIIGGLEEWTEYEVQMYAVSSVGAGPVSRPLKMDRTRESVPSAGPRNVNATTVNSTSIKVMWGDVPALDQNGLILGYRINYRVEQDDSRVPSQVLTVLGNTTKEGTIGGLRKFVQYEIQVLAFTRIGNGKLSSPPVSQRTAEDVPGAPTIIYFPEVTYSTAKVVWAPPREPNGVILGYKLQYRKKDEASGTSYEVGEDVLEYTVNSLDREKTYLFSLSARTKLGWGGAETVEVKTILNRRRPEKPTDVKVISSQIQARAMTIQWQPGFDWYGPIRNFTIQYQQDGLAWREVPDLVRHDVRSFKIEGLQPNTRYIFRVAAVNDIGTSPYSDPSTSTRTLQAAPDAAPRNLQVTPFTTSSVVLKWEPPVQSSWNSDTLSGYKLHYSPVNNPSYSTALVPYPDTTKLLSNLTKGDYDFSILAYNAKGDGVQSRTVTVYVGDAVPTDKPRFVRATPISSTEIKVQWQPPPNDTWNGELSGYKVFYWESADKSTEKVILVEATLREQVLTNLKMYTDYAMHVLTVNKAGDGPNSTVTTARTKEGIPGPPGTIAFTDVSLDSLNISWSAPEEPNGVIKSYRVVYKGQSKTVQVDVDGNQRYYYARELEENVLYMFYVKAMTSEGYGASSNGTITTGPQEGAPGAPGIPVLSYVDSSQTSVHLSWQNGAAGEAPITGYIIQAKSDDEDATWIKVLRKNSPEPEVVISYRNLNPSKLYTFRVIAVNKKGISPPSPASEQLRTPDFLQDENIFQQWWFLIIIALCGVILIIIVISLLCCSGRKRSKAKAADTMSDKTITTAAHTPSDEGMPETNEEDGGFTTFEMRQSRRGSRRSMPNGKKMSHYARSPPRPSPASVTYSDEESKPPGYDEDNSSSLSEKPSSLDSDTQASESEAETEKGEPESVSYGTQSFTNHYVNDPVRQTWRGRQSKPNKAYSYTDSEPDSNYAMSLNGGHVVMSNMAGSRAPLPGFSSFV